MATKRRTTSSGRKTKKQRMQEMERAEAFRLEIILWIIIAISLLLFISNFGVGGKVGDVVSRFSFGIFGLFAYIFPIALVVGSFFTVSNKQNRIAIIKLVFSFVFVVFLCVFMSLVHYGKDVASPFQTYLDSYETKLGGGILGGLFAYLLAPNFGIVGAYIIDIIVLIISFVIITGKSALKGFQSGGKRVYETAKESNERYQEYREYKQEEKAKRRTDKKYRGVSLDNKIEKEDSVTSDEMGELHPQMELECPVVEEEKHTTLASAIFPPDPAMATGFPEEPVISGDFLVDDISQKLEESIPELLAQDVEKTETVETPKRKTRASDAEIMQEVHSVEAEIMENVSEKPYVFPPLSLLKQGEKKSSGNTESYLRETANKLQQTLKTFGVNVTVTNISCGPSVTRYEIQPEMGVKVSKIVNLADDIKLNLAAADIRIEAPIPGKAAVGIEVPNKENVMVAFRDLLESEEYKNSVSKVTFAVGKDISGKTKVTDIAKMPHLLIAGSTGSGKSVCINTIIMSILYKAKPSEVKLIMIDPKVVELSVYNGIPHLLIPVVTDPKKAAGALHWAVQEMTDRYKKFAEANVREINGYNAKIEKIEVPEGQEVPKKMPQIVIIVDELADLMMVASNDVEEAICRLAQLARAAGIHLVIATQRPSVNVITGLIKANMPSRIAFAVTSGVDSRTILDMNGAEKLLGKGDMLFNPQGVPKPIRVQGAFVSDKEVSDVVNFITEQNGQASYSSDVQQKMNDLQTSSSTTVSISDANMNDDGRDSYFMEAASIIIDKEKASIGMLQRYLKVGFNRAARIMDQLEEAGIVGPEEGTKPRKVLMTEEEFQAFVDGNL